MSGRKEKRIVISINKKKIEILDSKKTTKVSENGEEYVV